jgi:hypothetical protein
MQGNRFIKLLLNPEIVESVNHCGELKDGIESDQRTDSAWF